MKNHDNVINFQLISHEKQLAMISEKLQDFAKVMIEVKNTLMLVNDDLTKIKSNTKISDERITILELDKRDRSVKYDLIVKISKWAIPCTVLGVGALLGLEHDAIVHIVQQWTMVSNVIK